MTRDRIASRTLIERGEAGRGAVRRAAAILRRQIKAGLWKPHSKAERRGVMRDLVRTIRHDIRGDIDAGKYRVA